MKIIVTGGRDYEDRAHVFKTLDALHSITPITLLIEGGATGADALGRAWAQCNGIAHLAVHAHWELYGNKAGPMRNKCMLDYNPDYVVAFPGGKGTRNMIQQARMRNVLVLGWQG